jgi:LPXTG-motif cell wall-anchored protein
MKNYVADPSKKPSLHFNPAAFLKKWQVLVVLLVLLFGTTRSASAAPVLLDDFNQIPNANIINVTLGTSPQGATIDHASILGGERDVQVIVTSGAGTMSVNPSDSSGYLTHAQPPGLRGRTIVSWDGNDSNFTSLNATGLGGVNLQSPTNDAFLLGIVSTDVASNLEIQVFTDATNHSTAATIAFTGGLVNATLVIPFSSFGVTGGTGADFTNVGAVRLTINSTLPNPEPALDMVVDFLTAGESGSFRDFGDLPDTYSTLIGSAGPSHTTGNLFLGSTVDNESDGNPTGDATGDGADEDGVTRVGGWADGVNGGTVNVVVTGDSTACLSAWMDFLPYNGIFDAGAEEIIVMVPVNSGSNNVSFDIPAGTFDGTPPDVVLNARFRLVTDVGSDSDCSLDEPVLTFQDAYLNGEVEDYQWTFSPTAITLTNLSARSEANTALAGVAGLLLLTGAFILIRRRKRAPVSEPNE